MVELADAQEAEANRMGTRSLPRTLPPSFKAAGRGAATMLAVRVTMSLCDQSGSPDGPGIAAMFFTFGNGINTGNHATALGMPRAQAQSLFTLCHGELTSHIAALTILGISHGSATSVQGPDAGGHEQAMQKLEDDLHVDPQQLELAH